MRTWPRRCDFRMWLVMLASRSADGLSVIAKMRSNLDSRAGGMLICSAMYWCSWNRPYLGLAAPSREHRHCNVAVMPAFATETVLPHQTGLPFRRTYRMWFGTSTQ